MCHDQKHIAQALKVTKAASPERATCCTAIHTFLRSSITNLPDFQAPGKRGADCYKLLQPISKSADEPLVTRICALSAMWLLTNKSEESDAASAELMMKHIRAVLRLSQGASPTERAYRITAVLASLERRRVYAKQVAAKEVIDDALIAINTLYKVLDDDVMESKATQDLQEGVQQAIGTVHGIASTSTEAASADETLGRVGSALSQMLPPGVCCDACRAKANSVSRGLLKCQRCGMFWFCSRACMKADWKERPCGHKAMCCPPDQLHAGDAVVVSSDGGAASFGPLNFVMAQDATNAGTWLVTNRNHACSQSKSEQPVICKRVRARCISKDVPILRNEAAVNNVAGTTVSRGCAASMIEMSGLQICE